MESFSPKNCTYNSDHKLQPSPRRLQNSPLRDSTTSQMNKIQTRLTCRQDNRVIMIKRGQMHNGEIIRTRPQCMNPSTSTQLCQTAWSIIFSNSCGLESDYRAPSVTQTPAPEQVTPWLFTNMSLAKIHSKSWNMVLELCPGCPHCVKFAFSSSDDFSINN